MGKKHRDPGKRFRSIPRSLKIGPHKYRISFDELPCVGDNKLLGQTDSDELTIKIDTSISETKQHETFWHEVTHALSDWSSTNLDEVTVERFSKVLFAMLLENGYLKK